MCDTRDRVTVTRETVTPIRMSNLWGRAGKIDFPFLRSPDQFAVMAKINKQAEAAKKKKSAEQREAAVQRAVELYKTLASSGTEKPLGYRTVCKMVEDELERETGNRIALCYNTVRKRLNGTLRHLLEMTEY